MVQISEGKVARWVQLVGMGDNTVTLAADTLEWTISIAQFESMWNGSFFTLWRRPPGLQPRLYAARLSDPAGQWIDAQLQSMQASGQIKTRATDPQQRLKEFQEEQGLPGRGTAQPSTFMRINQLTGVPEPKIIP